MKRLSAVKHSVYIILLFTLCLGTIQAKPEILTITHHSNLLDQEKTFQVIVPEKRLKSDRFPVLYMLHGAWGSHESWTGGTEIEELADYYQSIIVMPDGKPFGWYVNSPTDPKYQYESYIAEELIPLIDRSFPTISDRSARGIMGLSMGGHGAITLASKYPELFGSASSLSGILDITKHPDSWHIKERLGTQKDNEALWKNNSAHYLAPQLKGKDVAILTDCGIKDTGTGAIFDGNQYHKKMTELGIPHIWRELAGDHNWAYWKEHLPEHLNFHRAHFQKASPYKHYFKRMALFYNENSQPVKTDKTKICLFGSSSMQGFPKDLLKDYHIINRGISGDVLGINEYGLSRRMETSVFDVNPDVVFILNGRNDLGDWNRNLKETMSIDDFTNQMIERYQYILETIHKRLPKTKIVVITCPSTSKRYAILAPYIKIYTNKLKELCAKQKIDTIDMYQKTCDSEGYLLDEYSKDGLHMKPKGYQLLEKEMYKRMK